MMNVGLYPQLLYVVNAEVLYDSKLNKGGETITVLFYDREKFKKDIDGIIRTSSDAYSLHTKLKVYDEINKEKIRQLDSHDKDILYGMIRVLERYLGDFYTP